MSFQYKILAQETLTTNNDYVYVVPSGKQTIISSIFVSSRDTANQTFNLAIVPFGELLSGVHNLKRNILVSPSSFTRVDTKITLSAGDQIMISGSSTNLNVHIFGVEK